MGIIKIHPSLGNLMLPHVPRAPGALAIFLIAACAVVSSSSVQAQAREGRIIPRRTVRVPPEVVERLRRSLRGSPGLSRARLQVTLSPEDATRLLFVHPDLKPRSRIADPANRFVLDLDLESGSTRSEEARQYFLNHPEDLKPYLKPGEHGEGEKEHGHLLHNDFCKDNPIWCESQHRRDSLERARAVLPRWFDRWLDSALAEP